MGQKVNITGIQTCAKVGDIEYNFQKLSDMMSEIGETDLVVLPEVWNIGWDCDNFTKYAEDINNSPTIIFLSDLAKLYNTNIIGGSFIQKSGDNYYNSSPAINRKGELVAIYNKMHLYSYYGDKEGSYLTCGDNPVLVELDGIKYGLTVCYDIRFPEIYRAYRKANADVFINCAAWSYTKPIPWEMMTRARAVENQTYFVAVNQFGKIKDDNINLGHSRIIDYNGNVLSEILSGEGFIQTKLNMSEMYDFRDKCQVLTDIKKFYEVKNACVNYLSF